MKIKELLESSKRSVKVPKKFERFGFVADEVTDGSRILIVVYNQNNKLVGEYEPKTNDQTEFNQFVRTL